LLLDEPITNLDINAQVNILDLIDSIHMNEGLTTVMVMHHINFLPRECTRMVMFKDAKIFFDGPADRAVTEPVLTRIYGDDIKLIKGRYGAVRI